MIFLRFPTVFHKMSIWFSHYNIDPTLGPLGEVFLEDRPRGSACAFYVACLVAALEHLHERCIVHRRWDRVRRRSGVLGTGKPGENLGKSSRDMGKTLGKVEELV